VDFVPPFGREFLDYVTMDLISPDGVWGESSKGDADKGERAIQAQVKAITEFARQAFGSMG
jgi:creatinine amidohydrolase/Fe(II)-dependent formamide hydrolase-like protein